MSEFIIVTVNCSGVEYEWEVMATSKTAEDISACIEVYLENYVHPSRITRNEMAEIVGKERGYLNKK